MAIFEHRPPRDSGRRRQADLSLHDEATPSPDDLIDLPLGEATEEGPELRPTAAETVPIATQPQGNPTAVDPASGHDGAGRDDGARSAVGSPGALLLEEGPPKGVPQRPKATGAAAWGPVVRPAGGSGAAAPGPGGGSGRGGASAARRRPETIGQANGGGRWLAAVLLLALPLAVAAGYWLNRDPAIAQLSTELVDFGELRLGEVAQQPFEISNRGQEALNVATFELMGEAAADFTVAGEDCLGRPLAAGESCRVRLAFAPSASGPRKARLALGTSSAAGLRTLPLLGTGAAPYLEMAPPELDFGQRVIGSQAAAQRLWVSNTGSAPLAIRRVSISGQGADFILGRDECSRQDLAPGQRCALMWSFVPTAVGRRQGTVTVESDATSGQPAQLTGLGLPQEPALRLAPERLELAATVLGETSPAAAIDIFNDGNGALQVHDLRLQDTAGPRPVFRLLSEDCLQQPVAPGGSCRLEVVFEPQAEGEVSGFFEILHSAGEGRHVLPLVGNGLAPRCGVEPRRLAFGEAPVGGLSGQRNVEISSLGSAPLWVDEVTLEGADAAAFVIEPVGCLDDALDSGQRCTFDLRFRPRRDGPHRAELVIRHNAEGGVERLPLNGLGTSPRLELDPLSLSFGEVQIGQSSERSLSLSNAGRAALEIRRLRPAPGSGEELRLLDDRCSGRRLEAGGRCQVRLAFSPRSAGTRGGSLSVEHSAQPRAQEVTWRAMATAPPPRLEARPRDFEFANQRLGEGSDIRTLVLRNAGQGELAIAEILLRGPQQTSFQLVPGTCAGAGPLPPREECTVGVRFVPQSAGLNQGRILVRHNGVGGELRLDLSGRGVEAASGSR